MIYLAGSVCRPLVPCFVALILLATIAACSQSPTLSVAHPADDYTFQVRLAGRVKTLDGYDAHINLHSQSQPRPSPRSAIQPAQI